MATQLTAQERYERITSKTDDELLAIYRGRSPLSTLAGDDLFYRRTESSRSEFPTGE